MQGLMTAGLVVRWDDYFTIPAKDWEDLILWKEAEMERRRQGDN